MKINLDDLDAMYDQYPRSERIHKDHSPVGSLTDNRREVLPNRNGAHKRVRHLGYRSQKREWDTGYYSNDSE